MKNKETELQEKVISYLNGRRIFNFRYQAANNQYGMPDIICIYRGYFVGLELKTDDGKPTELQLRMLNAIKEAGGYADIIRAIPDIVLLFQIIDADISAQNLPE
jgi:hypothetical protein